MTEYNDEYNKIFYSITYDGIFVATDAVNAYALTSHLKDLYDKIAKLEKRLDQQEVQNEI
jgi:hypothetical protein